MKKLFPKIIFAVLILFTVLFISTDNILAQNVQDGLDKTAVKTYQELPKVTSVAQIVGSTIKIVLGLVGVAFFLLFTIGGLKWMIAKGNQEDVKKAKSIIINATIGIAITGAAYIVSYTLVNYAFVASGSLNV